MRSPASLVAFLLASSAVLAQDSSRRAELPVVPAPATAVSFGGVWILPFTQLEDVAFRSDSLLAARGIRVRIAPDDSLRGLESYTLTVAPTGVTITAPRPGIAIRKAR